MRLAALILLLLPSLVFGQKLSDEYDIYSKYLKLYKETKSRKIDLVINVSGEKNIQYFESDINGLLNDFRSYLRGDKGAESAFFQMEAFKDSLKKDTLWLPLIGQLNQRTKKKYLIRNIFSNDLSVDIFTSNHYEEYFGDKSTEEGWAAFHEDYGDKAVLVSLSEVANDGKRAVFYFSSNCGGLCGEGRLVLFYKGALGWQFVMVLPIWVS